LIASYVARSRSRNLRSASVGHCANSRDSFTVRSARVIGLFFMSRVERILQDDRVVAPCAPCSSTRVDVATST
jgi:hypothetical protein